MSAKVKTSLKDKSLKGKHKESAQYLSNLLLIESGPTDLEVLRLDMISVKKFSFMQIVGNLFTIAHQI